MILVFLCQQALEFLLKGILQYFDIKFPISDKDGHDIFILMKLLIDNTPIDFESKDRLFKISNIITGWKTSGRYSDGIKIKLDTLRNVKNIYNEINDSFIKYRNLYEEE